MYDENGESSTLTILMKDAATGLELVLKYGVFEKEDVITRAAELRNTEKGTISLEKCCPYAWTWASGSGR